MDSKKLDTSCGPDNAFVYWTLSVPLNCTSQTHWQILFL